MFVVYKFIKGEPLNPGIWRSGNLSESDFCKCSLRRAQGTVFLFLAKEYLAREEFFEAMYAAVEPRS